MSWITEKREACLQWAHHVSATRTGWRKEIADVVVDAGETLANRRSFSQVFDRRPVQIVGVDGDSPTTMQMDVLRRDASRYMGAAGYLVAAGSFLSIASYAVTGAGALLFAGVWAAAHARGDEGLSKTAKRMCVMSALMTVPVFGNGPMALFVGSEIGAALDRKKRMAQFRMLAAH
jgi:hypothetical protein